jgi:hypothetical protein
MLNSRPIPAKNTGVNSPIANPLVVFSIAIKLFLLHWSIMEVQSVLQRKGQ